MSRAHPGDERTLRRARMRLAWWSGAIALVVLMLLGGGLYTVVMRQLAADSEAQLRARAEAMASDPFPFSFDSLPADGFIAVADDAEVPGLLFGGPLSGTVAEIIILDAVGTVGVVFEDAIAEPDTSAEPMSLVDMPQGLVLGPDSLALGGALDVTEEQITTTELEGTPVRVLLAPFETAQGPAVVRVLADRTAEIRTLESLLLILLVAIPLVAVAAGLAGWAYSGRALAPIGVAIERQRRFAADASHELRTPLAVVSGNLQALAGTDDPIAADDEAITDSIAETERMTVLLDDLLILARSDAEALPIEVTAMDLADEAAEAADSLAPQAALHEIELILDVEPAPMHGDPGRLRQLVVILVDNAIRYDSSGGHVWITVRGVGGRTTLVVADDGPGLEPTERELAFERFWRGPGVAAPGNGLGLSIARWIVDAHDGHIEVDERPGGGARFTASLLDRA